jgi:diguanylate cyclase (GGDEF)-like protein/PAS domain S-box-containing protein
MRVLLVQGTPPRAEGFDETLRARGHEVVTAAGLEPLRNGGEPFACVVLAYGDPEAGVDLCRQVRACSRHADGAILALAPSSCHRHLEAMAEAGVDDLLPPPADPEQLGFRVELAARRSERLGPRRRRSSGVSSELFRQIVETMSDGLGVQDREGRIQYVNTRLCEMLGYAPEEMMGRRVTDFLDPTNRKLFERRSRRGGGRNGKTDAGDEGRASYELDMVARDGSRVSTIQYPRAILEDEGRYAGTFAVIVDVTERKKVEHELQLHQFLIDRAADAAFWAYPDSRFFYVNEAACAALGYSRDELLSMRVSQILPADSHDLFERVSKKVRGGPPRTFDTVHIRKDGAPFPVEVTLNHLCWGGSEYYCAFARDITERKQAEQALRESEERYRSLFEGVPVGLYRTTPGGRMLDANDALVETLGYPSREALLEMNVADAYVDPEDRRRWQRAVEVGEQVQAFEAPLRRWDGGIIWARFTVQAFRDGVGRALRYEGALEDVTDRRRAEEGLRASEERFRALVQNASDLISILDPTGTIRYESPSHHRVLGHDADRHVGKNVLDLVHPDDRLHLEQALRQLVEEPEEIVTVEYRLRHRDGGWRVLESTAANLLGHPAVEGIVLNSHDVSDRKRAEERLLYDALHDELTGLPNRALFMDRLRHSMELSRREPHRMTAVLFLDLDRFKIVNDSLGHLVGDELLVQMAGLLSGALRPSDTIARVGGDEFAVLLEGGRDVGDAVRVAERIHALLAAPIHLGGHEVFVTASVGIAIQTPEYERPEDLLRDADTAMYRAKSQGRACHVVFNRVMHRYVMARLQLETDLRRGLDRGQLRVFYQPFVSLQTGGVVGFEALMRWYHPRRGLLPPDEFLSVAEETGVIVPMGRFVLAEACRQIREFQRKHPEAGPLRISVNLSNKQFFQTDLFDQIEGALADSGLDPSCLGLEITEGVIIRHAEAVSGRFARLKEIGVKLYLDDFGKGYSSLNYLHRFPIDILKIDRSFVTHIHEAEGDRAIVQAIVTLAHQLGMAVVAEGIQVPEQGDVLRALSCEYGQGHLFSTPVSADQAERLLLRPPA